MTMIMLEVFIGITIIYAAFVIWNTFIAKKQVRMSAIDVVYCIILAGYVGTLHIYIALICIVILLLWLIVMSHKWNKNLMEKNRKMMEEKEEAE